MIFSIQNVRTFKRQIVKVEFLQRRYSALSMKNENCSYLQHTPSYRHESNERNGRCDHSTWNGISCLSDTCSFLLCNSPASACNRLALPCFCQHFLPINQWLLRRLSHSKCNLKTTNTYDKRSGLILWNCSQNNVRAVEKSSLYISLFEKWLHFI